MPWFRLFWTLLLVLTVPSGGAQPPAPPAAVAPLLNFRQVLERPDRPQPQQRVAYAKDAPQQAGELWLPPADRFGPGPYPVVLMVHGGCWLAELPGPELLAWQAEAVRQQGFAVWSISYRRIGHPGGGYPGTFQDVAAAVQAAYPDRQMVRLLVTHYARPAVREVAQAHGVILVQSFEW